MDRLSEGYTRGEAGQVSSFHGDVDTGPRVASATKHIAALMCVR